MDKKIIILISAVVIIIVGALFLGLSLFSKKGGPEWVSSQKLMNSGKIAQPGKILELVFDYDEDVTPDLTIKKIAIKNGFAPSDQSAGKDYTLKISDARGTAIKTVSFSVPDEHSDDPQKTVASDALSFVVTLPYLASADKLEVVTANGVTIISKSLQDVPAIDNKPNFKTINQNTLDNARPISLLQNTVSLVSTAFASGEDCLDPNGDDCLDIVFIGERYSDLDSLETEIISYKDALETLEPFKSRKSQIRYSHINIFNNSPAYCQFDPNVDFFPVCDEVAVVQAVNDASALYDKIVIVLDNSDGSLDDAGFGGMAQFDQPCCAKVINKKPNYEKPSHGPFLFVHELGGHLFGGLSDEYIGTQQPNGGNCYESAPPNPDWQDMVALRDYRQRCSKQDWWRSYEISIMDNYPDFNYFNAPSQEIIEAKLDEFAGSFSNSNAPTASITSPSSGANVSGTISVKTSLSDDLGIARANLYLNGTLYQTAYENPFSFSLDTTEFNNGSYTLEVKAFDIPGNTKSATVTVNISNSASGGNSLKVTVKEDASEGKNKIFLNAGTYSVTEDPVSNWDFSSATCVLQSGSQTGSFAADGRSGVTVISGETTTCTFNNIYNDKGSIKVIKKSIGGNETFSFDSNFGVSSLTTSAANNGTASQTIPGLDEGSNYYISETDMPDGWELSSADCDNGGIETDDGYGLEDIVIIAGQTTTCTFTNTYSACVDTGGDEGIPFSN